MGSDTDGKVAKAYGLRVTQAAGHKDSRGVEIDHGFTERTTFIVTPDGQIAATLGGMTPADNVENALKTVQKINAAKPAKFCLIS